MACGNCLTASPIFSARKPRKNPFLKSPNETGDAQLERRDPNPWLRLPAPRHNPKSRPGQHGVHLQSPWSGTDQREDLIGYLIEFVARIWDADTKIRDGSILGESKLERDSRRSVAWLCGGIIFVLTAIGFCWWWFTSHP